MKVGIIGSGIAGLTATIIACEQGHEVYLYTKEKELIRSASAWAQGGIVYQDESKNKGKKYEASQKLLKADILKVAGGMAYEKMVDLFVREAPSELKKYLIDKFNIPFTLKMSSSEFDLTEEAAHSEKRILYADDKTGEVIVNSLINYLLILEKSGKLKILRSHILVDLINLPHHSTNPLSVYEPVRCVGGYFLNLKSSEFHVIKVFFDKIILATGGIGQIYLKTTNPKTATGDGLAVAARAGARIVNMEFTQFHPTSLSVKKTNHFLISEVLRGEGAELIDEDGKEFMSHYHKLGSLAPRDVVARAMVEEQRRSDGDLYLSLKKTKFDFAKRFPRIYEKCIEKKIDFTGIGIPVTPAFHFSCGGILTNEWGETSVNNLFAIGECACTGIHGANRLASTSLLEGFFFGIRAARAKIHNYQAIDQDLVKDWECTQTISGDLVVIKKEFDQLKLIMWNYVGIVRTEEQLKKAIYELKHLLVNVENQYRNNILSKELIELRNAVQTGLLVANSAIKNKQSAGCHYLK